MATETGLDLEAIRELLDTEEWEDEICEDHQVRRIYLGTVFDLFHSGKYYTAWACSNVTEEEAQRDEEWREAVEEELGTIGACLVNGDGDPCDLFIEEIRDVEEEGDDEECFDDFVLEGA